MVTTRKNRKKTLILVKLVKNLSSLSIHIWRTLMRMHFADYRCSYFTFRQPLARLDGQDKLKRLHTLHTQHARLLNNNSCIMTLRRVLFAFSEILHFWRHLIRWLTKIPTFPACPPCRQKLDWLMTGKNISKCKIGYQNWKFNDSFIRGFALRDARERGARGVQEAD